MTIGGVLPVAFFEQPVLELTRQLLGKILIRETNGDFLAGMIVETEAYVGEEDQACHARSGRTERTKVMYGPPGHAYVYFTYGMHWLLNCVAGGLDSPAAVLIRALVPLAGEEKIRINRNNRPEVELCNGPAKICQAFEIDGKLNGVSLYEPDSSLRFHIGRDIPEEKVTTSARIGINSVPEPWRSIPWRFEAKITREWINKNPGIN